MNFKVGQKVVCVIRKPWFNLETKQTQPGAHPKLNDVVTIDKFYSNGFLFLKEFSHENSYDPQHFRALDEVIKGVTMTFEKLKDVQPIYQS